MYADLLFLNEFLRDYLIITVVSTMTAFKTTKKRQLVAAGFGALLSTLLVIVVPKSSHLCNLIFGIILCMAMIKISFKPSEKAAFIHLLLYTYAAAFIIGGIITFLQTKFKALPSHIAFLTGFLLLKSGIFLTGIVKKRNERLCQISIKFPNEIKYFKALIDSGNLLIDKNSGLPISIIESDALPSDLELREKHFISFNSLGCTNGKLEFIYIPYICIDFKGNKKLIKNAPVGISKNKLSQANAYQMIISPDIIEKL